MLDNLRFFVICAAVLFAGGAAAESGTWAGLQNPYPNVAPDTPLLLTDGTVIVHETCKSDWYKLTPDINGDYAKGTWTQAASLRADYRPQYFASQVLADGRVMVSGGEYDGCTSGLPEETNESALYDPQTDTWTDVPPPPGWTTIGNAASVVRPDKTFQVSNCCSADLAIATIKGNKITWQILKPAQTGKNDFGLDESWTALPDQRLLTIDTTHCVHDPQSCTEIFDLNTNTWSDGQRTCAQMVEKSGNAPPTLGPSILAPKGFVLQIGAQLGTDVGFNCILDPASGNWSSAPSFPNQYDGTWSPAAVLPNGNIFVQAGEHNNRPPSHFFEFAIKSAQDVTLTEVAAPPMAAFSFTYEGRMLVLPTGQILWSAKHDGIHHEIDIYTPSGKPKDAWRPVVRKVGDTLVRGTKNNKISGRNFNGFTYGGVSQMSTNYPLVRITNTASGHVCYARTHDHNRMGIADGSKSSTKFDVPNTCDAGAGTLEVVANGIASKPVAVTLQ